MAQNISLKLNTAGGNVVKENEARTLIGFLPKREQDVIIRRFGLFGRPKETLESIGQFYNITRERVRQIQDHGIFILKNKVLPDNPKFKKRFELINQNLEELGRIAREGDLLDRLQQKNEEKNYLRLLFVLNPALSFSKENDNFYPRWSLSDKRKEAAKLEESLKSLSASMSAEEVFPFDEILKRFQSKLKNYFDGEANVSKPILCSWLNISKDISQNTFGEWGLCDSCHINPRGVKDYAYLSMKKHGSPMHFREVSKAIQNNFKKPAHVQTVHNELIKDNRFILVGRGLYALKEWGYIPGTVRDVIFHILQSHERISKEELVKKILKERHVQETTIAINLQNRKFFKKFPDGAYGLA